jgi:hypothetical protein
MIIRNRWIVSQDNDRKMVAWHGSIPYPSTNEELDNFIRNIYSLAYEEGLYRVVKKKWR